MKSGWKRRMEPRMGGVDRTRELAKGGICRRDGGTAHRWHGIEPAGGGSFTISQQKGGRISTWTTHLPASTLCVGCDARNRPSKLCPGETGRLRYMAALLQVAAPYAGKSNLRVIRCSYGRKSWRCGASGSPRPGLLTTDDGLCGHEGGWWVIR
ncbi:hypothetical protein BC834DRAFT_902561 [Gloeopeniophorella convolvens]|nr:hypothetical protein BC834DRAFT_902561 [Gloeopeniophorella convolvens]